MDDFKSTLTSKASLKGISIRFAGPRQGARPPPRCRLRTTCTGYRDRAGDHRQRGQQSPFNGERGSCERIGRGCDRLNIQGAFESRSQRREGAGWRSDAQSILQACYFVSSQKSRSGNRRSTEVVASMGEALGPGSSINVTHEKPSAASLYRSRALDPTGVTRHCANLDWRWTPNGQAKDSYE